jgi:hypothetical protein
MDDMGIHGKQWKSSPPHRDIWCQQCLKNSILCQRQAKYRLNAASHGCEGPRCSLSKISHIFPTATQKSVEDKGLWDTFVGSAQVKALDSHRITLAGADVIRPDFNLDHEFPWHSAIRLAAKQTGPTGPSVSRYARSIIA